MTTLPLFVYGTLQPGERNHARFLAGRTVRSSPAWVRGELWLVADEDYPYLCSGKDRVLGTLITLAPEQAAATLRALDRLEDCFPHRPDASLYRRQKMLARHRQGETLAWVYLWNRADRPGRRLASGDFRRRSSEG